MVTPTPPVPTPAQWKVFVAGLATAAAAVGLVVSVTPSSTPTPTPTVTATPVVTPTATVSVSPSVTPTPSVTASVTPTPSVTPSVTPSPTPSVTTPTSGFPDASTTGWRHTGVTLSPSGPITVTADGTVIDGKDVTGNINVKANNVTISRSRVTAGGYYAIRLYAGFTGLTVVDTEVIGVNAGTNECDAGINGGTTIMRVDVSNCQDLVHPNAGSVLSDSFLHNPYHSATSHNDGIQLFAGSGYVIQHNTILMGHAENSAVFVKADFGNLSNIVIDGNRLDGGVYTVFGGDAAPHTVTNVEVTNNVFTPFVKGGSTGAVYGQIFTTRMTGPVTITGNVDTAGAAVS